MSFDLESIFLVKKIRKNIVICKKKKPTKTNFSLGNSSINLLHFKLQTFFQNYHIRFKKNPMHQIPLDLEFAFLKFDNICAN